MAFCDTTPETYKVGPNEIMFWSLTSPDLPGREGNMIKLAINPGEEGGSCSALKHHYPPPTTPPPSTPTAVSGITTLNSLPSQNLISLQDSRVV